MNVYICSMSSILDLELGIDAQTAKLHVYDNHIKFEVFGGFGLLCGVLYHLDFTFANSISSDFQNISYIKIETDANHSQSQAPKSIFMYEIF